MLVMALDGNSLAYRAFFALPEDMTNASGQTTNAVYGFTTMLVNLIKEHKPDGVVVVFDRPEPTFRHEAIPEYKAQREKAPETLRSQLGVIRELLDVFGITWLEMAGFEGDDLIATMADRAEREGRDILIVTGDRDSYQLVHDPHVRVLYNKRGVSDYAIYDEAGILERTGVTPAQYPDYAALRGDPSDNLDGIPGVGEKTAAKLVTQYGNLAAVLAAADEQTPKLKANLHEHGERVTRNASMMVLRRDVPIDVDLGSLAPAPDMPALRRLFEFLEFKTMTKRVDDLVKDRGWAVRGDADPPPTGSPSTESTPAEITFGATRTLDAAGAAQVITSLPELVVAARWEGDPGRSPLAGISVVVDAETGETGWIPSDVITDAKVGGAVASHRAVVAHDAKPIMRSLLSAGIDMQGLVLDTQIATYLVDPSRSSYSLASVCLDFLGAEPSASVESTGQFDFGGEEAAALPKSCGEDAVLVGHLASVMRQRLASIDNVSLYTEIENPLVHVLARMEHLGIAVDRGALENIRTRLTAEASELTSRLYEIAGKQFNVNSTNQLREILYDDKGLTPGKKTKTGYSTDAATLEKLHDEWPEFIGPLLRYREVEKLRSTYGEGLLAEVGPDSRIHATFNQTVARTGRLSSDRPNLHNIPVRTDEGRVFRTAFVARAGCELMVADYNQIELRCIAHLADDPGLVTAFNAGEDIHRATAARVFGVDPAKVTHDQRSKAKMVSYGLAYGMEAYGLSQRLGIAVSEASEILDSYFAAFPNVKNYMESAVSEARNKQYTETLFKRRRPIPELLSDNFRIRQAGERQAMNAAIQGLAADIFKIALVRIDQRLRDQGLEARLVLQVHDEVIVESPVSEHDSVNTVVLDAMKGAAELRVPLEVNAAWGPTWAEAKA
jgi:DNA polymerase-1